jgi:N-acetyl-alpha-D-glucosaminyl L-malate synthase BshA
VNIGIVCYPTIGGSGIVATELGLGLCERKYSVHFISYDVPHRLLALKPKCRFHHIRVPMYPVLRFPPYGVALASELCRIARECKLDIIHVHYAIPHSSSALLAKTILSEQDNKAPQVVTTLHGTDTDIVGLEPTLRICVEWSINRSDAVTAVSNYLRDHTLKSFQIAKEIEVIHNPINTKTFSPGDRPKGKSRPFLNSSGIPWVPGEKVLLHASNFRPVKRVLDVVKIFDLVSKVLPARLVFVGEGPDVAEVHDLSEQLGLASRVHFLGKVLYIEKVIREADLFLSTSESESFGMSIAEAMSCEVPVVASLVGGVPEVMVDGETGVLFPCGDVRIAACAATDILVDPDKAEHFGKNGRKRIQQLFDTEKILPKYEALYERLAG